MTQHKTQNPFQPVKELRWLFLDLNSYFASVEQQDRPELRGKPVAIVPSMTDSTCAIAASAEAKAFGIKTGTMIYEAKKRCPDLVCVLARHDVYVNYHHRVFEEVEKHLSGFWMNFLRKMIFVWATWRLSFKSMVGFRIWCTGGALDGKLSQ